MESKYIFVGERGKLRYLRVFYTLEDAQNFLDSFTDGWEEITLSDIDEGYLYLVIEENGEVCSEVLWEKS